MSNEKPDPDQAEIPEAPGDVADETTHDAVPEDQVAPRKRRPIVGAVAWLAMLLAIAALLAIAYTQFSNEPVPDNSAQTAQDINELKASVQAARDALTALEQSVSTLSTLDSTRSAETAEIERQLGDRLRQLEPLAGRLTSLESTMSALQGVSAGARNAWLLAEAEYYMQIANAQLQLAGNPHLATLALNLADERLVQLSDPGLVQVRRALSAELQSLEQMEKPDTEGITLTLASLASSVDALPLDQEIAVPEAGRSGVDPELSGVDRAMASLRGAFGKVVSVRRSDEALKPLLAPEAQYFLRANLSLQLQAARLAVLRNEETIFRQSLEDAMAWISEYYDTENVAVQSALATIEEIRGSVFSLSVPDISESLRLLRQFNEFGEIARSLNSTDETDQPEAEAEPLQ